MSRGLAVLAGCAIVAVACGSPTGPTVSRARAARLARTRFMAFGDSLTLGEITAPVAVGIGEHGDGISKLALVPGTSYPEQLKTQLSTRYASQASSIVVTNAGVGGETIVTGALRFADALSDNAPEAVIIMEGVNGLGSIGPDVSTTLIRDMVRTAQNRGTRVFIASMLPTIAGRQRSQNAAELEAYDVKLRQMSMEEGATFVDLYATLLPDVLNVIGIDGLHPTEAGYRRIAEVFFNSISTTLEER